MKQTLFFCSLIIVFVGMAIAQTDFSPQDSVLLAGINSDTVQLRQLTVNRHGERIAAKAQNLIGRFFYAKHLSKEAEREFLKTYKRYPNTPEAVEASGRLGSLCYWSDRYEQAKSFFKEYLKSKPTGKDAQWASYSLVRSMFYTRDSSFLDAAQAYFAAQHDTTASKDDLIQYDIVRYLGSTGQFALAIQEANNFISRYPVSDYIKYAGLRIAQYYSASGNIQAAIDQCKALIDTYDAGTDVAVSAQNLLASFYADMEDFNHARTELTTMSHTNRSDVATAATYGLACVDMNEGMKRNDSTLLLRALHGLRTYVQHYPTLKTVPKAMMNIATLSTRLRRFSDAIVALNNIIGFDSTLIDTGRYAGHSDEMKSFQALVLQAHLAKGMLLHAQMHDPARALGEFEMALAANPDQDDVWLSKALCLIDLNRKDDAKIILNRLINEQRSVKVAATQILSTL